jgi:hypothetical protein
VLKEFEIHWDVLREKIAVAIVQHPLSERLCHVLAKLCLRRNALPRHQELGALANELVAIEAAHLDSIPSRASTDIVDFTGYRLATAYVGKIVLMDGQSAVFSSWDCANATCSWIGLNGGHLQAILDAKKRRAQTYRTNMRGNPIWLLVHSGLSPYVSSFPVPDHLLESYRSDRQVALSELGFDEVWYFSPYDQQPMQLHPLE